MQERSNIRLILLASGLGGILFVAAFVVLGLITPGYDSLHQTISSLEFTTSSLLQRINFFLFGVLLIIFAAVLRRELNGGRGSVLIPLFQAICGAGVIGDAIFIYEPLHLVCDLIAFNASLLVLFLFAWRFSSDIRWQGWAGYSILTAILMMIFLTAFGVALHAGGWAGAFEKLASMTRTLWSVALVCALYSGRRLDAVSSSVFSESTGRTS